MTFRKVGKNGIPSQKEFQYAVKGKYEDRKKEVNEAYQTNISIKTSGSIKGGPGREKDGKKDGS